jgi:hypothetical protein
MVNGAAHAQVAGEPSNDSFKAQDLHVACSLPVDPKAPDVAGLICQSFLRGLTDGLFLMKAFTNAEKAGCLPSDSAVSIAEARAEFKAFFVAHPEMADNAAGLVAVAAIMRAHPC